MKNPVPSIDVSWLSTVNSEGTTTWTKHDMPRAVIVPTLTLTFSYEPTDALRSKPIVTKASDYGSLIPERKTSGEAPTGKLLLSLLVT